MFRSYKFGKIASFNYKHTNNYNWNRRNLKNPEVKKEEAQGQKVKKVNEINYLENLKEFLSQNMLLIKYKKGDKSIDQIKKNFKADNLQKLVKLRSDKKLEWSPQYYLNNQLTFLKDVMDNQILYLTLLEQEKVWNQSSEDQSDEESDGFDDKSASDEESDEEDNEGNNGEESEEDNEGNNDEESEEDNEGNNDEDDKDGESSEDKDGDNNEESEEEN